MSRPLSILYDVSNNFAGLQEMNDVRLEYPVYQICKAIADENQSGGNLTIGINDNETSIGTYIDTYYSDTVGTHDANTTIQQQVYTVTQKLDAGTTAPTRPVEYSTVAAGASTTTGIRPMTNDSIRTEFFDRVVLELSSRGLGSYMMQVDSPASPGETWIRAHTLTNTSQSGSSEIKIWRKTGDTAPTEYRPLRIVTAEGDLREMSDTELQGLFDSYADYVIDTGRGQYRLQENNPATAGQTWYKMGSSIKDTRVSLEYKSYVGAYNRDFVGAYNKNYVGRYVGGRVFSFLSEYLRNYRRTFGTREDAYFSGWVVREDKSRINISFIGFEDETYESAVNKTYQRLVDRSFSSWTVVSTVQDISTAYLWLRTK
jgi:hypothetical protein